MPDYTQTDLNRAVAVCHAAGETWVDSIPLVDSDGSTNISFAIFIIVYNFVVAWVIVHLTIVVLLDNFVKATAVIEHEEEEKVLMQRELVTLQNPMAPLLRRMVEDFVDDEDLSQRLQSLFKVLISTALMFLPHFSELALISCRPLDSLPEPSSVIDREAVSMLLSAAAHLDSVLGRSWTETSQAASASRNLHQR